ncbi:MAG: 23S rRNA (adenine(2503)-C(2))-methyltransferase RlmN [Planctomycetota bacterium]
MNASNENTSGGKHLLDIPPSEARDAVDAWIARAGATKFRADQVCEHVFRRKILAPSRMSNIPESLREQLAASLLSPVFRSMQLSCSKDGTRKYGFALADGALIESVWIPTEARGTLCVSSQAGCPAGCTFCATGAGGFRRNLRPSEIIGQWLAVRDDLLANQLGEVTQIVFMGMGEPLLNFPHLLAALRYMTASQFFAFSPRRITVSTVGVAPRIAPLLAEFPQVRLALSLHSAIDITRSQIVPMNRKYSVADLRKTLQEIRDSTRRITLEYVLLNDVNDSKAEAIALAQFATDAANHINLLPFHPFPGASYPPTGATRLRAFRRAIESAGYRGDVTLRKSRGLDIQGACGQLALHQLGDQQLLPADK